MTSNTNSSTKFVLESTDFQRLIDVLVGMGYRVIGPTLDHNAVIYDDIASVTDLPIGWTDEQDAATYRLTALGQWDEAWYALDQTFEPLIAAYLRAHLDLFLPNPPE